MSGVELVVFVGALVGGGLVILAVLVAVVAAVVARFYRRLDDAGDPLSRDARESR